MHWKHIYRDSDEKSQVVTPAMNNRLPQYTRNLSKPPNSSRHKEVACRHCETTEFMLSDTAVEEPQSILGLRRNALTSSRQGGDKDKKEPSDNPSSSKIKRVSVDAAFLISDQLRQLCSRQIPRPMNLLTNKGCKLVGSFLSSSQILRFCGF